jgi:hypothetical protein
MRTRPPPRSRSSRRTGSMPQKNDSVASPGTVARWRAWFRCESTGKRCESRERRSGRQVSRDRFAPIGTFDALSSARGRSAKSPQHAEIRHDSGRGGGRGGGQSPAPQKRRETPRRGDAADRGGDR